jgi:hypothetical protein
MHVARAPRGRLLGEWEYSTGAGWSRDPAQSVRVLPGVANEYSVTRSGDAYVLITMDTTVPLSNEIKAYVVSSPTGPWSASVHVYSAPEAGGNVFVYNAHAHPSPARAAGCSCPTT